MSRHASTRTHDRAPSSSRPDARDEALVDAFQDTCSKVSKWKDLDDAVWGGMDFYSVKSLLRNRTKFRDWLLDAHYTQSEIGYWKHKAEGQNWTTPQVVDIAPRDEFSRANQTGRSTPGSDSAYTDYLETQLSTHPNRPSGHARPDVFKDEMDLRATQPQVNPSERDYSRGRCNSEATWTLVNQFGQDYSDRYYTGPTQPPASKFGQNSPRHYQNQSATGVPTSRQGSGQCNGSLLHGACRYCMEEEI